MAIACSPALASVRRFSPSLPFALVLLLLLSSPIGAASPPRLSLTPDDPGAGARNAAAIAALSHTSAAFRIGKGRYYVANPVAVTAFSGELVFERAAGLVALNASDSVLRFANCSGFAVSGLNVTFATQPMRRVGAKEAVCVYDSVDTLFRDVYIDGSAAAGLLHCRCLRPVVMAATVRNTMADGVHFCNSANVRVHGVLTEVGDGRGAGGAIRVGCRVLGLVLAWYTVARRAACRRRRP